MKNVAQLKVRNVDSLVQVLFELILAANYLDT